MNPFRKLVLGYAPTRRFDFPDPVLAFENSKKIRVKFDEIIERIGDVEVVDLSFLNDEALLYQVEDVEKVSKYFRDKGVEAIFMPHANFGCEEVVGKLGKAMQLPLLLWGPRDEAPPGGYCYRQTDTQCGLFASSMALLRADVPFSYIENCWLDSPLFAQELDKFIRTACVVKTFKNLRIGQIGPRPKPFASVMIDEGMLLSKFGIDLIPIDGTELIQEIAAVKTNFRNELAQLVSETSAAINCSSMTEEELLNNAAVEIGIEHLAKRLNCNILAGECWFVTLNEYNILPCYSFGNLTEKGLPVICETDVYGAVTTALITAASRGEKSSFTADMTIRHPTNDNAELLWHCGPFPKSLAKRSCNPAMGEQCTGRYEIVGGDITVARFGGIKGEYKLFFGEGKGVDGPETGGNYVWMETSNWAKWERKLMYGPYIHHVAGIHGKYADVLREACRYIGVIADGADD